jgi:AcrR family transcriptional regulator
MMGLAKLMVKRNKQKATRKAQILSASTSFFSKHGYRQTDIQAIADFLKIGKGTIYRYFPSKEELFLATVDDGMNKLQIAVDLSIEKAESKLEKLNCAIYGYLDFFDKNPELPELLIQERAEFKNRISPTYFIHKNRRMQEWTSLFEALKEEGVIRSISAQDIFDILGNLLYGTMFTNFHMGRKSNAEQVEPILDIVKNGILA